MKGVSSLVPALFWAVVLSVLSAIPGGRIGVGFGFPHMDKVVHFLLYAALGLLLAVARRWSGERFPHLVLLVGGWVYGAMDEWHQSFVPGRSPEFSDWAADVMGVTVGYLLTLRLIAASPQPPERPEPGEVRERPQPVPPGSRPYPASESATGSSSARGSLSMASNGLPPTLRGLPPTPGGLSSARRGLPPPR